MKLVMIVFLVLLSACQETEFKESITFAGGKIVDAKTLNLGKTTYMEYCVQCHGVDGKGKGPASQGLIPPPRNLTQGLYKFANVPYGELPHDEDFKRIIRKGLNGSAMLAWDIHPKRLDAVIQYIKTFAKDSWVGADKELGTKIEATIDPYGPEKRAQAIERGKVVYHMVAQCTTCHRGYESKENISKYSQQVYGEPQTEFDSALYQLKAQESEYDYWALPPDFTYHELRSVYSTKDIYNRLVYGVTGSGMPGWKDVVSDDDLWALTYYVEYLREFKEKPTERKNLVEKLKNQ